MELSMAGRQTQHAVSAAGCQQSAEAGCQQSAAASISSQQSVSNQRSVASAANGRTADTRRRRRRRRRLGTAGCRSDQPHPAAAGRPARTHRQTDTQTDGRPDRRRTDSVWRPVLLRFTAEFNGTLAENTARLFDHRNNLSCCSRP